MVDTPREPIGLAARPPTALTKIFGKKKHPYFGSYELDYEKARAKMLLPTKERLKEAGMQPLKEFWLNDDDMEALILKEIDQLSEENKELCYILPTYVWTSIHRLRRSGTGHIQHPANRYEAVKHLVWPRRNKKRIEAQKKFNPLRRKYLFLPVNQDAHWSLIVVVNPWKTVERLVDPDPTTEVFNMPVNPDGNGGTPCDVSKEFAEEYNLSENERIDTNRYSQFAPYESEPVIYHLCSLTKSDWIQKCELACELLTGMFLDEDNPDLKDTHLDLLKRGLLIKTDNGLQILNGRRPRKLVCDRISRGMHNRPWPCDECLKNEPNRFQKFLPFRYYHQSSPQQFNEYDCGVYTIYAVRKWMLNEKQIKRYLHRCLDTWWSPVDVYNYKYATRRYFDKLANVPDREPVNIFGSPEENGYLGSSKDSFLAYRRLKGLESRQPEKGVKTEPESEEVEEEVISQDEEDLNEELIEEAVEEDLEDEIEDDSQVEEEDEEADESEPLESILNGESETNGEREDTNSADNETANYLEAVNNVEESNETETMSEEPVNGFNGLEDISAAEDSDDEENDTARTRSNNGDFAPLYEDESGLSETVDTVTTPNTSSLLSVEGTLDSLPDISNETANSSAISNDGASQMEDVSLEISAVDKTDANYNDLRTNLFDLSEEEEEDEEENTGAKESNGPIVNDAEEKEGDNDDKENEVPIPEPEPDVDDVIDMTNDAELPKPVPSKKRKRRAKAAVSEEELASYAYAFEVHRVLNLRYSRRAASTPKIYTPPTYRRTNNTNKVTKRTTTKKSAKKKSTKKGTKKASTKTGTSENGSSSGRASPTKSEPSPKKTKRSRAGTSKSPARSRTPNDNDDPPPPGAPKEEPGFSGASMGPRHDYSSYLHWIGFHRPPPPFHPDMIYNEEPAEETQQAPASSKPSTKSRKKRGKK